MNFTIDELLQYAKQHEGDEWTTLVRQMPFRYHVTDSGIEYTPSTGKTRLVHRQYLESFCDEFKEKQSFSPGDYPHRWNKSYSLPLIQRFLKRRVQHA